MSRPLLAISCTRDSRAFRGCCLQRFDRSRGQIHSSPFMKGHICWPRDLASTPGPSALPDFFRRVEEPEAVIGQSVRPATLPVRLLTFFRFGHFSPLTSLGSALHKLGSDDLSLGPLFRNRVGRHASLRATAASRSGRQEL